MLFYAYIHDKFLLFVAVDHTRDIFSSSLWRDYQNIQCKVSKEKVSCTKLIIIIETNYKYQ